MTLIDRDVAVIAPLGHERAMQLAAAEYRRMSELLRSLEPAEWTRPSDCIGWDVRTLTAHLVGTVESLASLPTFARFMARVRRRPGPFVDAMTALHVEARQSCQPAELVARFDRATERALRTRARLPRALGALRFSFEAAPGTVLRWKLAYLFDVILTRDVWMHRVDISRPLGRSLVLTPEHDGALVADVVAEWARTHGEPFRLVLDGPAGGTFRHRGAGPCEHAGEEIGPLDAVEFCRIVSGRGAGPGLLTTEVPF
jgi:uncharacterized protein (TIGR03083 family)